jgi:hypothetical protein
MMLIDRPGSFRGKITEAGVGETKNGYPQFICRLQATEFYDEQTQAWVDWSSFDQDIVAYLVLYTKDKQSGQWKELLNAQQLKKALGWDGTSFATLANGDYSNTPVLFRVETDTYNGNESLKVSWIDAADANPTRQLTKFDSAKLAGLDSAFKGVLGTKAPVPASAKPPTGKPVTPPKRGRPPKATPTAGATAPSAAPASVAAPSAPPVPASPAATPPAPSGSPKPTTPATTLPTECTKDEAWAAVCEHPERVATVTDDKIAEMWLVEAEKFGKAEDAITPKEWALLRDRLIEAVTSDIPY